MARIFFSVDVHGSTLVWRKWLTAAEMHKVDVLILAGDLTGKALIPIIKQKDGTWRATYFGRKWILKNEEEIKEFEEKLEGSGPYYVRITEEELKEMQENPKKVEETMNQKMVERLRKWLDLLLEHVDVKKTMVIVMPGNDDEFIIDDVIKEYEDRGVIYPLDKILEIEGHEMISSAYVNPTPWNTPREMKERELLKHLERLIKKMSDPHNGIFNFHCPPYGTHLDLAPKLTKDLRPVVVGGMVEYQHVGSKSVLKVIKKYQPILGLHGHIHESASIEKIGRTLVVNPGSEYGEGVLKAYVIEVNKKGVGNYWRLEG